MKIGSKSYLTLGFIVTSGLTGLGQGAPASPETSLTVTIHVYNFAEVDHKTLIEAENVATGIFRKAGLETRWINPAVSSEHGEEKSTAERTLNLSHIQLNILPPLMTERLGLPNNVMGLAPGTEPDRQRVFSILGISRRRPFGPTHRQGASLLLGRWRCGNALRG